MASFAVAAAWLACAIAAQAPVGELPPPPDDSDLAVDWYSIRHQEADGHWSSVRGGGLADADLRVTAWMLLAHLGDGSTMHRGRARNSIKATVRWLLAQQDDKGRLALRADPAWLLDHAMATYALAEALRLSSYRTLAEPVQRAVVALERQWALTRPAPGVELRLWGEGLVRSLQGGEAELEVRADTGEVMTTTRLGADALRQFLQPLPVRAPSSQHERAAQLLRDALRDAPGVAAAVPALWPADPLAEPLTAFYVQMAAFRAGGETWKNVSRQFEQQVMRRQIRTGDERQGFPASGAFSDANGRFGTSAVATLMMEVYYRYCRLGLLGD